MDNLICNSSCGIMGLRRRISICGLATYANTHPHPNAYACAG
jgi:hypothetical protein